MAYDSEADDFKAIADGAKKSPAFKKLAGSDTTEPDADDASAGDEDASLGAAFDAISSGDVETFKTEMAAAMRACYESVKK